MRQETYCYAAAQEQAGIQNAQKKTLQIFPFVLAQV
jgi:hypothetical protein